MNETIVVLLEEQNCLLRRLVTTQTAAEVSLRDAARMLGKSERMLITMQSNGVFTDPRLTHTKGKRRVFLVSELEAYKRGGVLAVRAIQSKEASK